MLKFGLCRYQSFRNPLVNMIGSRGLVRHANEPIDVFGPSPRPERIDASADIVVVRVWVGETFDGEREAVRLAWVAEWVAAKERLQSAEYRWHLCAA